MGTGIGIKCRRCGEQLNYDDGFNRKTKLCDRCYSIVRFENPQRLEELKEEIEEKDD